ncbi:glycosyltransferase family 2 protein (plasmid) [Shinella sp. PSBB067]|uniref:glycosyltransferase family 2 protein n=1 Tax=Shinella sp. PSBB067 TaxID=2715959 RepID=UPI00193BC9F6|nr:glycosyltransferase family 2 protein [Shinella sp. PSBB067]QRI66538.1 glycosyltransferase family 2 protein [Shinella sp. PSBB067]
MAKLTVIIPFYQKEPGILRRALASVFAQGFNDFDVIVVDDESPWPPDGDLIDFSEDEQARVRVIRQENAGPGGARNTGLDHVPAASDFVAFLDSDDTWAPGHLAIAHAAMTHFSADCYFASITGGDGFYYHFGVEDLERTEATVRLDDDPLLIEIPDLTQVMLKNWSFLHLSAMVIARPVFERVRFDAALRLAAEDVLFFCDCVLAARRVVLSGAAGAVRGEGINIFHGVDNDSPQFLRQQFNTWVALDRLESRFAERPAEVASLRAYKQTARRQALWSQARRVRHRKLPQFDMLARWAVRDPRLLASVVGLAVGKFSR